ncbi:hypothetical protein [Micromonospora rubida]|uniref:hypothetical protein n=1 Tax=Micromonospora rubida TaxID=2697657 RepID=UPI00191C3BC0|nr:hypothetical protein [Micromonospora rubida]
MLALAVLTILTATAQQSHADTEMIALPVAEIRRRQSFDQPMKLAACAEMSFTRDHRR